MEATDLVLTDEDVAIAGSLGHVAFLAWLEECRDGRDFARIRLDMKRAEFGWLPAERAALEIETQITCVTLP